MLLALDVLAVVDPVHEQPHACPAPDPAIELPAHRSSFRETGVLLRQGESPFTPSRPSVPAVTAGALAGRAASTTFLRDGSRSLDDGCL